MLTTMSATCVALLCFGLFTRDGLYVLMGVVVIGAQVAVLASVLL